VEQRLVISGWLILVFLTAAPGRADGSSATAPQKLDAAFKAYCAAEKEKTTSDACLVSPSAGVEWLILDSICPKSGVSGIPYCDDFNEVRSATEPAVLAYNHETARWTLVQTGRGAARMTLDANGVPTVYTPSIEHLTVVVDHTNPLLYGYSVGSVTATPIAVLADLTTIVGALGTVLQGKIVTIGQTVAVQKLMTDVPDSLALYEGHLLLPLKAMAAALADLNGDVRAYQIASRDFVSCAQKLEFGLTTTCATAIPRPDELPDLEAKLNAVDAALNALRAAYEPCLSVFHAFTDFVDGPSAPNLQQSRVLYLKFQQLAAVGCAPASEVITRQLQPQANALNDATGNAARGTAQRLKALDPSTALSDADKVLSKRSDLLKTSYATRASARRFHKFLLPNGNVLSWFWIDAPSGQVSWQNVYTYPVTVAADATYKDVVTFSRGDKATQYKVGSARANALGIGVGVVYTPLAEATWGAIAGPSSSPGNKIIAKTDTSTRAGQVALFADYKFLQAFVALSAHWPVKPFVQFGAGLSTTPQAYLGGGLEFFKALRVSGGWTYQRFKLLNGQTEGMPVSSKDDIKTMDHFGGGKYVAVSFALDAISLISKPK
jgi:hypothetical protein